jgi:BirA family biotin operon repressor/biotin-[acetyl-CoA-carboxylase] ligase
VRDSVESTNDEVRELARAGAPEGLVVLAERQTAGRGRRGAAWFSPFGQALTFSVLLRPAQPKALWPRLALATGLAVAEALETLGVQPGIKWPNDVWIGKRKVAGILVEAGSDFAVIGIGLNVNNTEFPNEVVEIATSLRIETTQEISRSEVLSAIIRRLSARSRQIGTDFSEVVSAVQERCVLTGQQISLTTANGPMIGSAEGIAPGGELLIRTKSGLEKVLQADDVRVL